MIFSLKKKSLVAVLLMLFLWEAKAQQETQYTQYMYNPVMINPAYAGNRGNINIVGGYRKQWLGMNGAPENLSFAVEAPLGGKGVGVGLGFIQNKVGSSSESNIHGDFSYLIQLNGNLKLSFGIKAGLSIMNNDPGRLTIYDPNDYDLSIHRSVSPLIGAGTFLHSNNWYVGLSTPNFLETRHYKEVKISTASERTHFYLMGGYVFTVSPYVKLKPGLLAKAVTGAPLDLNLSANVLLYDRLDLGLSYKLKAAIGAMAGFQINDLLFMGYSYGYDTTELSSYNNGLHELILRFELFQRNYRFF